MEIEATAPAEPIAAPEPQVEAPQEPTNEATPDEPKRSRLEALEKAFEDTAPKGEDGPEPQVKAKEEPKPKTDDKPKADTQERGPDGKFVAKQPETPADGDNVEKAPEQAKGINEAPSRFSADAKAAWERAPESVRGEALRAIRELEAGIQQKGEVAAKFDPFIKMANGNPDAVVAAMSRYVNTENTLRQNPVQGFTEIAQNMGLSPQQVGRMLLGQEAGQPDAKDQQIMALSQQVQQLMQAQGQISQTFEEQQRQAVTSQVDQFAAEHPRFDELAGTIEQMLSTGFASDLKDAYEKADRLNPAPQPEPPAPAPAAQTREVRSVTGAPTARSNPATRQPSASRKEALERAARQVGL